jgi:alpha-ketoglutarate-dependent taurine dioxygenase
MVCTRRTLRDCNVPTITIPPNLLRLTNPDDTILDSWQVGPNRPPIDTHHPAVRTHPVTGLKALNINNGFVTSFPELKKEESDKLLEFFRFHIHSADDHYVRWKWAVGSVAMWDNVCTPKCSLIDSGD